MRKIIVLSLFFSMSVLQTGSFINAMEPVGSVATVVLSFVCPPAGAVLAAAEAITFGVVGIGAYLAYKKNKKQKKFVENVEEEKSSGCSSGGAGKDPKDEEDEECEFGTYKDALYHGKYKSGCKSPRPFDGQKSLDYSLPIEGYSSQRIGIEGNYFIIFKQTSPGVYHGYRVSWQDICSGGNSYNEAIRKTLIKNKWVTRAGKIIQQI